MQRLINGMECKCGGGKGKMRKHKNLQRRWIAPQLLLQTTSPRHWTTFQLDYTCIAPLGSGEAAHFKLFCLQSVVKKRVQCKQGGDRVITRQRRSYRDLKTLANLFSMNPKMLGRQTVQPYHGTIMLFFVGQFCATVWWWRWWRWRWLWWWWYKCQQSRCRPLFSIEQSRVIPLKCAQVWLLEKRATKTTHRWKIWRFCTEVSCTSVEAKKRILRNLDPVLCV